MNAIFSSTKEKSVFAALRKMGDLIMTDLAKVTLINRTSLYPIIQSMTKRGLIKSIRTEKTMVYSCLTQDEFKKWLKRRSKSIHDELSALEAWSDNLEGGAATLSTETKYYEGAEAVKSLYDETWRNNEEGVIYAITDYEKAYESMGDFFRDDYFQMRVKKGVQVKSLLPDSDVGRRDKKVAADLLREMKFIDLFQDLGIELNIFDDKVAIVAFDKKKPTGVLIKNPIIARAFKNIYNYLWRTAK